VRDFAIRKGREKQARPRNVNKNARRQDRISNRPRKGRRLCAHSVVFITSLKKKRKGEKKEEERARTHQIGDGLRVEVDRKRWGTFNDIMCQQSGLINDGGKITKKIGAEILPPHKKRQGVGGEHALRRPRNGRGRSF